MSESPASGQRVQLPPAVGTAGAEEQLRAQTYSLLSNLLAGPPDSTLIDSLKAIDVAPQDEESLLAAAWRMLAIAASRTTPADLEDEYQTLFIGIGRGELVPYGSWYLTGFLMEQPLARLRTDLRVLGIERHAGVHEPEDHAAALCAAMALLAMDEDARSQARQRDFFLRHLEPWMTQLFLDMQQAPSARFYRAVGQLGEQFMAVEGQAFRMSLPPAAEIRDGRGGLV